MKMSPTAQARVHRGEVEVSYFKTAVIEHLVEDAYRDGQTSILDLLRNPPSLLEHEIRKECRRDGVTDLRCALRVVVAFVEAPEVPEAPE